MVFEIRSSSSEETEDERVDCVGQCYVEFRTVEEGEGIDLLN